VLIKQSKFVILSLSLLLLFVKFKAISSVLESKSSMLHKWLLGVKAFSGSICKLQLPPCICVNTDSFQHVQLGMTNHAHEVAEMVLQLQSLLERTRIPYNAKFNGGAKVELLIETYTLTTVQDIVSMCVVGTLL